MSQTTAIQPSTPSFAEIVKAPIVEHLGRIQPDCSRRELLDLTEPYAVLTLIQAGTNQARATYSAILSRVTQDQINSFLDQAQKYAAQGATMWRAVDQADRTGSADSLAAGFNSSETEFGVQLGDALLPGWGAIIGGAIGGFFAGKRVEEAIQKAMQQYLAWFDQWINYSAGQLDQIIDPSVARDAQGLQGPPDSAVAPMPIWQIFTFLAVIIASVAGWLYWDHLEEKAKIPPPVETPKPATENPRKVRARGLAGTWKASSGEVLEASTNEEATVSFTVAKAPAGSLFKEGDIAFHIIMQSEGNDLPVRVAVYPLLPPSIKLDEQARRKCLEEWIGLGNDPLKVHLEERVATVDVIKMPISVAGLDMSGGKIRGCKSFDSSKATKSRWVITRETPSTP